MTKFKKVVSGIFGFYIFAVLSLSHAQNAPGPDRGPRMHPGQRIQEIYNQLNLTDDQKKLLEENKKQHRERMANARQEMKTDRQALQDELMKPRLDMPRINGIHSRIKALQSQMEDNKLSSILAVRTILTPEQFLKFVNLMQKHREEHGQEHE